MNRRESSAGLTLIEVLVGLTLVTIVMTAMASLLVSGSRTNREQQRWIEVQSTARSTMELITQAIRTAGWDPAEVGFSAVKLDTTPGDGVETLELFADLNGDMDLLDVGESMTIRHVAATNQVEWRRTAASAWEILGIRITNDADEDGVPEPMFSPDATPDPARLTIQITAAVEGADPQSGEMLSYTLTSDVLLRNQD